MVERPPTFFVDRGLGSVILPRLLREAGSSVTTMDERYGAARSQGIADVDWIRDASEHGDVLRTKDVAIARRPVEAQVVHMCDAAVVTVTNTHLPAATTAHWLLRHEAAIMRWAARTTRPFVLGVYEKRIARLRLHYP
ncbi:hypothetical protein [Luteimicrobium sp. DT211]|uniref:PIN-like domain-containing protein n=1 Tax=Luteimicrobium sp. DT211 TaxID=3393412 RepID=UPI003CEC33B6